MQALTVKGPSHRGRSLPISGSVEQLLGAQQHPVAHLATMMRVDWRRAIDADVALNPSLLFTG